MPPLKKPVKKTKVVRRKPDTHGRTSRQGEILFSQEIVMMPASRLKPHPDNPNLGDVDAIVESIVRNGVFNPVLYNKRNGMMAAGHHTKLAMVKLGHRDIPTIVIDVSEEHHRRIMLAYNQTAKLSTYDPTILAKVLADIGDITGTGFTELDYEEYAAQATRLAQGALAQAEETLDDYDEARQRESDARSFDRSVLGEEPDVADDENSATEDDEGRPTLEKADDDLQGAFQLKPDMVFDGVGIWGIPRMRTDRLMTFQELPQDLEAWAGSATKDWPVEDQWWLYNFGIDSTSGMRDVSKVILSFYCFDQYFENWWFYPERYVAKVINSGIKYAVMPDYSMHEPGKESRVISMWSLYRSRWLARYMQEAGIRVIPNVTWATQDISFLTKYTLSTLPKNVPLLALQVQTVDDQNKGDVAAIQLILDTVKPDALLIYYGKRGRRVFDEGMVKFKGDICFVESRMAKLAAQAGNRKKKKTL